MSSPVFTRAAVGSGVPSLDVSQRRVARAVADGGRHVVHGAPGSGKTHLAVALTVTAALAGERPILLVPTRTGAADLRTEVTRRIGRTLDQAVVRTPAALAFAILRLRASHLGEPAPTLISGPEQDQVLAELLAGHAQGEGRPATWPEGVGPQTWGLQAFRNELRDVLMRAAEAGLSGAELSELGRSRDRPEWVGAGQVLTEYTQVMALGQITPDRGARYDAAGIVDEAVSALLTWDRDLPGVDRPRWSLVVHDDYQDATLATARLLGALGDDGAGLVVLGDADAAVQSFRGGVPALLSTAAAPPPRHGGADSAAFAADAAWGATEHVLDQVWRHGRSVRDPVRRLTRALPVLAAGARREAPGQDARADHQPRGLRTAVLGSAAQEVAFVARQLRIARLHHRVPWSQMAVVARSSAQLGSIRRGLRAAGVPLTVAPADLPLREEPAVRPLLAVLRTALAGELDLPTAIDLLSSPIGGLDSVALRGLRRYLRARERQEGGIRSSAEALLDVLSDPDSAGELPVRYRRGPAGVARVLSAARDAVTDPEATAETVLWAAWEATGLAGIWQQQALSGGVGADRADADLDAVLALFRAAEQFMDRTAYSSPGAFVEHLMAQDFPADTLAARGHQAEAVAVHTAAGAAGGQWEVVAVVGVQEDVWPDLRIRDTLLGSADLADLAAARDVRGEDEATRMRRARRDVADGELRAFISACSRARRLLYVTAILDEDERPSMFLDLLTPGTDHETTAVPPPLDLRGLVGQLRAALRPVLAGTSGVGSEKPAPTPAEVAQASEAAAVLSYLAERGVAEADPSRWGALFAPTTEAPLLAQDQVPTIGPSAVEQITTCPLRWVLTRNGGEPGVSDAQQLGNLIHEIAAAHPDGDEAGMRQMLERRWPDLGLAEGWMATAQRARAESMITRLSEYMATRPGPVDVEVAFTAELDQVRLRGRVDRVEHVGQGQVRIVDLKTGTTAESVAKARTNPQLGAYQVATEAGAFGDVGSAGAALVYPGTKAKAATIRYQPPLAEAEDPRWAHHLLADAGRILRSGTFEARPNEHCPRCPVRSSCPAFPSGARVEPVR
ncbi:PD-(D/E)XK nuclease family protein [Pseudactinotalea sp. Z1748]|uniref:PD-(D/E)XK nuclease family protein n=1 Tax=Pseudactinotalea sp. Z1748 TaxID=3413027 RepID=UPI003C7A68EF